jgi:Regulator of Chromosome Condensation (RCC1) repeat protein
VSPVADTCEAEAPRAHASSTVKAHLAKARAWRLRDDSPFTLVAKGLRSAIVAAIDGTPLVYAEPCDWPPPADTCALKRDGSVGCWGENEHGQVGKGDVSICQTTGLPVTCDPEEGLVPRQVVGLPKDLAALALRYNTSCAYNTHGSVWCWGATPEPTPTPIRLQLPEPITALSVGDSLCVALQSGRVLCHDFSRSLADWSAARQMDIHCSAR